MATPPPTRPFRPGRRPADGWGRKTITIDLARQIDTGRLPPNSRLPSRAELVAAYAVSDTTIKRALDPLHFTGRIRGEQGRAVFVVGPVASG